MHPLDIAGIVAYFLVVLLIGIVTAIRIKTTDDFAVAGNRVIWPVLFATLAATFLGGGATMGRAGQTYDVGYSFAIASIAFPIQTILVGLWVAPRLNRYRGAHTIGDVMALHSGKAARLIVGIISILVCTGILGAQALALGTVFHTLVGVPVTVGIVASMLFVLVYSTAGGMWADIQTDVVQFILLGVFLPVALIIGIHRTGGVQGFVEQLPAGHLTPFGAYEPMAFLVVFLAFALGETLIPPYAQRAFSATDPRASRIGYAWAGVFGLVFYFVSATLGLVAFVMFPDITGDQALPTVVLQLLPIGITGLVAGALMAVIMSTADSLLNSATVSFSRDIFKAFIKPDLPDRTMLWVERGVNVVIGLGALVFAVTAENIVDALMVSYELWAPTVIFPLLMAVLTRRKAPAAIVAAMVAGGVFAAWWIWVMGEPAGISGLMVGLAANIITYFVVYYAVDVRRLGKQDVDVTSGEWARIKEDIA